MKFTTTKQNLLSTLKMPSRVTGKSLAMSCLRFRVMEGELAILGTNKETWTETRVKVEDSINGEVLLPEKVLVSIIKSLPEGEIHLEQIKEDGSGNENGKSFVKVSSGKSEFELTVWGGTLPEVDRDGMGEPFQLDPEETAAVFEQVAVAASTDGYRQALTGAQISADAELAATDSYRLSLRELPSMADAVQGADKLVPAGTLHEVAIAMQDTDAAQVRIGERSVEFAVGATTVASTLIVGEFPNYRNLMPERWEHEVTVERLALASAVTQAGLIAAAADIPVALDINENKITVSANAVDVGKVVVEVGASHEGETLRLGFNPKYLVDGLNTFDCESVVLRLNDPLKPATINDPDKPSGTYLLMPVRIAS